MADSSDDATRIEQMVESIARVAEGDYELQIELSDRRDELDGLAMAINLMLGDLRTAERRRRQVQEELAETEEKFRRIVSNAQAVIFIVDRDGRFVLSEGKALRALGLEPGQVVGTSAFELYADYPAIVEGLRTALGGQVHQHEVEVGGLMFDVVYCPHTDGRGATAGAVGMAIDITRRWKALGAQHKLEKQLRHAQKMEAVGRLAGGVAHDFNNMLTSVTGNVAMAKSELAEGHPALEFLEEIDKSSRHATELVRQLLTFSRHQIVEHKVLDPNEVIDQVHGMLIRMVSEDIELTTSSGANLGRVEADRTQLEQILINLAINASDAMPSGGTLSITTANTELDAAACATRPGLRPGRYVEITVRDSGHGMDEATRQSIFEPFFTTKPAGAGTGLGLSMVYGAVRQAGGHIDVISQPGEGSEFRIFLPTVDGDPAAAPEQATSDLPSGSGRETVLLVEDDRVVRKLTSRLLRRLGYQVIEADCGAKALGLMAEPEATADLLLTDVVMPGCNGRELAEQLTTQLPQLRVLYTSGYSADVISERGAVGKGINFIGKPYTPHELDQKLRQILDD